MSSAALPSEPFVRAEKVWAVVFHIWEDEPIYHAIKRSRFGRRTLCGRVVGLYTPCLPMKHAERIGRPCKGCWPQE